MFGLRADMPKAAGGRRARAQPLSSSGDAAAAAAAPAKPLTELSVRIYKALCQVPRGAPLLWRRAGNEVLTAMAAAAAGMYTTYGDIARAVHTGPRVGA